MSDIEKKLSNPPKQYRPIPFWSWNEKLDTEETTWQIEEMDKVGLGGYFMHARGGLQTEYMGSEWMDNIRCGIEKGKKRGMSAWGYDENGWPSGFGGGLVNGLGEKYQQKYLRYEFTQTVQNTEHTICNLTYEGKNIHLFYEVNPFYVDTMNQEVIAAFLEKIHMKYKKELGEQTFSEMAGFFTDEPQISRDGIPWSLILPQEYEKRYQEDLVPQLLSLFFEVEGYQKIRFRYWKLVRDLFTDAYMKQIYEWCEKNNTHLTGHMVLEESMEAQLTSNSACMPSYEYMHIPGMDWLGRIVGPSTTPVQLASVAAQTGKKQVLSETFALCGWDVSFEELKWIYEWQMVRGINLLCQHLEGYSLRGIRKRDYPATLFYQQPWWKEYKQLNDIFSRIGMLLAEGTISFKTLVVHPIASGWVCFNNSDNGILRELDDSFAHLLTAMDEAQIPYHIGDERIMERHGAVNGKSIIVGKQQYDVVIVPDGLNLSAETVTLLEQYQANGGLLLFGSRIPGFVDGLPSNRVKQLAESSQICHSYAALTAAVPNSARPLRLEGDCNGIASTFREFEQDKFTMYYIVNTAQENRKFTVSCAGKSAGKLDYFTGSTLPICYIQQNDNIHAEIELPGMGSIILFVYPDNRMASAARTTILKPINDQLCSEWKIAECDPNALTLDYCDCYFDGKLIQKNWHVSNIQEEACKLERPVNIDMVFHVSVEELPATPVYLVMETPEKFTISVNGTEAENKDCGYYRDKSFRKLDLKDTLHIGENEIKLSILFEQREEVYQNIRKSLLFESEKNMLTYDTEIEAIYLIGEFAVQTSGIFEKLDRHALRYDGGFSLAKHPDTLRAGDITEQGFPFFNGRMLWKQTVTLNKEDCRNRSLIFSNRCDTVTKVRVNRKDAGTVLWQPYEVSLDGLLQDGENEIEIEIVGNLRNLLGPHHLESGESYLVAPGNFFENSPIWCDGKNSEWDNRYCFVRHGLYL